MGVLCFFRVSESSNRKCMFYSSIVYHSFNLHVEYYCIMYGFVFDLFNTNVHICACLYIYIHADFSRYSSIILTSLRVAKYERKRWHQCQISLGELSVEIIAIVS